MRSPLSVLLALLALGGPLVPGGIGASEAPERSRDASPVVYELGVNGLSCPFCSYGIEKKLERVEGVEHLEIRLDEGVVRVRMAPGASLWEERARQIVKDAGFALRSFRRLGRAGEAEEG